MYIYQLILEKALKIRQHKSPIFIDEEIEAHIVSPWLPFVAVVGMTQLTLRAALNK